MLINTTSETVEIDAVSEQYIVFFSSIVNGKLWCPDCVRIDDLIQKTFGESGPTALIAYVGDRAVWRDSSNPYRNRPWKVNSVPTIIKLEKGKEAKRLVDQEISEESLAKFIV